MPKPKIIDTADTMTSSKLSALKKAGVETIIRYDDRRPRGGWKQIHPAEACAGRRTARRVSTRCRATRYARCGICRSRALLRGHGEVLNLRSVAARQLTQARSRIRFSRSLVSLAATRFARLLSRRGGSCELPV